MLHKNVSTGDNHFIQQWNVSDSAGLVALSTAISSNDIGKVAYVTASSAFYILQATTTGSGATWQLLGSGGGGGGGGIAIGAGTQTATTNTVNFANSNGVSFGMSGSNQITADFGSSLFQQTSNTSAITSNAFPSANTTKFAGTGTSATNASITLNSNGLAISVGAGGGGNFSAGISTGGNTSGTSGTVSNQIVFVGGNNVTLSQSTGAGGATVTISGANVGGAQTGISGVALSNTTYTSGTVSYRDLNGITWQSTTGQGIQITHDLQYTSNTSNITSNAFPSANTTKFAGTGTSATGASITLNSNGLAISVTQPTVTNSTLTISDNATSIGINRLAFTNLNGMTMSLSTTTGGSATVVGSYTVPTVTQYFSNTATTFNGTNVTGSITNNTNGIRIDVSAGAGLTSGNIYATGNTTQTTSNTVALSSLVFEGAGIASVGVSNNRVLVSVPSGGGAGDGVNIIQIGTTGTTGTSFSSISGTVQLNGTNGIIVSQNNSDQIVISNALFNGVAMTNLSFTTATSGISISSPMDDFDGWNLVGANTAGTTGTTITTNGAFYLSGGNNVTLSGNSNTIVISAGAGGAAGTQTYSRYPIAFVASFASAVTQIPHQTSGAQVIPFYADQNLSFNQIKMLKNYTISTTTFASTANTTVFLTHGVSETFQLLSRGSGASTSSLMSIGSTSFYTSVAVSLAYGSASNTTQGFTYNIIYPHITGGTTSAQTTATTSNVASLVISTQVGASLGGARLVVYPYGTSITSGQYFLYWNLSTNTTTSGVNLSGVRLQSSVSMYPNLAVNMGEFFYMNGNIDSLSPEFGGRYLSSAAISRSTQINLSDLNRVANYLVPYITFVKS